MASLRARGRSWFDALGSELRSLATAVGRPGGSARGKLLGVTLSTTAIALAVAGIAMLSRDLGTYRNSWAADLATQAQILAASTAPALAFNDRETAVRNLNALAARESLRIAAIYHQNGTLYASYRRDGDALAPPARDQHAPGLRIAGERIELTQRIVDNGEVLGTIYLRATYDVRGRVRDYVIIFAAVTLLSMGVALLLSSPLQRRISAPLDAMASIARLVVERRDYSRRAGKAGNDEIGVVVDAFNKMLDEVQARARELEESNQALQAEVAIRQGAEQALARANARLESAMAAAEIGSWVFDFRTQQFTADRNFAALFGSEDDAALSGDLQLHRRQIHPDDIASVIAAETTAVRTGRLPATEFRIIRPNGEVRWVVGRGKILLGVTGRPRLVAGLLIDITAQKAAEQALRASEQLYRAIGESMQYGVWVCDADGRNTYVSESFLRLTGLTQEQCSKLGWSDVLHPDDVEATLTGWQECVRTGGLWYREHRFRGTDGLYHPVLAQGAPIRGERGEIAGWAGINLDISRLKKTEAALLEADRRKDEFLATLAHELRNPLAPIRNAAKILDNPAANERQRQWGREVITRQVQHMALLLDDLLDVSRITRGRLELKKDRVPLGVLIANAIETARPLIEAKHQVLEVVTVANPPELEVDALRISQALANLLTNAAKYTDAGGHIAITATVGEQGVSIAVKDTGIGLSAAAIARVFDMFSQVESAVDRSQGGLGIGLALVKGLISLHGGTVSAVSEGLGCGSTFTVQLPRAAVISSQSAVAHPPEVRDPHFAERCKVLVADDNKDTANTLAMVLEMNGFEVLVAYSGSQALEIGSGERPDACVLDIGMPGLSGHEAARRIRREAWGKEVLLVTVTGWGQQEDIDKAYAAGFDYHFTKPVDLEVLQRYLTEFMSKRRAACAI
jgi:PAS domain S-box-containing protein